MLLVLAKDVIGKSMWTTTTIISTEIAFADEDKHFLTFLRESNFLRESEYDYQNNFQIGAGVHGGGLDKFLHKIDATGSIQWLPGSSQ